VLFHDFLRLDRGGDLRLTAAFICASLSLAKAAGKTCNAGQKIISSGKGRKK
jgi:hypothetical protein